ncbi:MAG: hypothetical protein QM703_23855 [Gemmatales bacterium]
MPRAMNEPQNSATAKMRSWWLRLAWGPTLVGLLWIAFAVMLIVQGIVRGFNLVTFLASFLAAMWVLNLVVTLLSWPRLGKLHIRRRLLGTVHAGQAR